MTGERAVQLEGLLAQNHASIQAVDRFPGYAVDVALPRDWAPFDTFDNSGGARVWAWPNDPRRAVFCANAVLVLQHLDKALDPETVFSVMCERHRQSVPGSREQHRRLSSAADGSNSSGTLALKIDHEVGAIDSVTHTRIVVGGQQTLIAHLTVTALHDSPVDYQHIRLNLVEDHVRDTSPTYGGQPTSAPVGRQ